MQTDEVFYTTKEAAEILGVDNMTIGAWIRNGDLNAEKKNPLRRTSGYRIPKSEVDKFLELRKKSSQKSSGAL